jgi:hypothetical protein
LEVEVRCRSLHRCEGSMSPNSSVGLTPRCSHEA